MRTTLAVLLVLGVMAVPASAQTVKVTILDNQGNQAFGTINSNHLYLQDGQGHIVTGTIRNGNVFLTRENGEITFGTVRDGNVFLADKNGVTTGTIHNGNIFLSNSDGSITTGTYTSGNTSVNATPNATRQTNSYQDGYAMGLLAGTALRAISHRLTTKQVGMYTLKRDEKIVGELDDGTALACSTKKDGCRMVEAPIPVRANLLMEAIRKDIADDDLPKDPFQLKVSWEDLRGIYCFYARRGQEPSMTYVDLQGPITDLFSLASDHRTVRRESPEASSAPPRPCRTRHTTDCKRKAIIRFQRSAYRSASHARRTDFPCVSKAEDRVSLLLSATLDTFIPLYPPAGSPWREWVAAFRDSIARRARRCPEMRYHTFPAQRVQKCKPCAQN